MRHKGLPGQQPSRNQRRISFLFAKALRKTRYAIPYGAVIVYLGTNPTSQQYKFGGKELITSNGINEYDFGARNDYPAVPAFTRIDPFCEDTEWLSPYLYCGNNPVNAIDPDGRRTFVNDLGVVAIKL
ncbi:MAG: hypothetical protein K2L11_03885 [Muribaculaceae bacterium]|nr:hypothetical protein [Muribaculaceae bacterium]